MRQSYESDPAERTISCVMYGSRLFALTSTAACSFLPIARRGMQRTQSCLVAIDHLHFSIPIEILRVDFEFKCLCAPARNRLSTSVEKVSSN